MKTQLEQERLRTVAGVSGIKSDRKHYKDAGRVLGSNSQCVKCQQICEKS